MGLRNQPTFSIDFTLIKGAFQAVSKFFVFVFVISLFFWCIGIIYTIQLDTLYTLGSRVLFYNEGATDEPSLRQATVLPKGEQECLSKKAYVKVHFIAPTLRSLFPPFHAL